MGPRTLASRLHAAAPLTAVTPVAATLAAVTMAAVILAGCGTGRAQPPPGTCPTGGPARNGDADIDWVDFVVVGGITLSTVPMPEYVLRDDQIGAVVATVTCRIDGVVRDPDFRPRDGDAAFLPVGTRIHAVVGSPVTSRVAARTDGVWRYYRSDEASPSPSP